MMARPSRLSRVNAAIQQAIAAAQRIFEMLDTHSEVRDKPGAPPLAPVRSGVEFRDVGFAYDDEPGRHVLRNVSFSVRAGQVVAIVGLSGAGKTSLVNLIPRFFDVTEGSILIDGVDIREVSLASLRRQTALVTQETVLFDDTIAANIAYGVPDADPARSRRPRARRTPRNSSCSCPGAMMRASASGASGCRADSASVRHGQGDPEGLPLRARRGHLGAGRRVGARSCRCTGVNLMQNRTTFVIAHRLSTVRRADLIIALEKGRVVETGTHDELVNRPDGVYARLHALQAFDERDRAEAEEETTR
jgi:subfamily B ATP-binding cassette protein MsbA